MAEIHVEKKRGIGTWIWAVVVVVLIAAAAVYLWQAGYLHASADTFGARNFAASTLEVVNGA